MNNKLKLVKDYSYPNPKDPDLLAKIFKKREFYYYRVPKREIMKSYDEIKKYRSANCKDGNNEPKEQQYIIPNFISPNTSYKGVLLMHGVGTGKTQAAIRLAEQFKDQVKKYNTKIYILVPGPNTRENFKKELISATGETYLINRDKINQMSKHEIDIEKKNAIASALNYYRILSYKTFLKKVLGEKMTEKKIVDNKKIISSYLKDETGEYTREIVVDRITNLNNSIIIVDEAHNITGNDYGEALKKIIKNSVNLRVVLLTATPMINFADEIVDMLNFLRPENDQIQRDKIFTSDKSYTMKIKPNGLEYLKDKARGYISYYRGSIPYTFAERVEMGTISEGMLFTPVIKCDIQKFQYNTIKEITKKIDDINPDNNTSSATVNIVLSSAGNFVFPGLSKDKTEIVGCYSTDGIHTILSQLNTDGVKLRSLINKTFFKGKLLQAEEDNFIISNENKYISGLILDLKYIKDFSIKFYNIMMNLKELVDGKKGSSTAFIYSNLVKAGGIELFAETLIQNGYLEYNEDNKQYDIKDNTIDYKTGLTFLEFKKKKLNNFKPTTFLLVTGGSDESGEDLPEIKQKIIQEVFNNSNNTDGRTIKFILGSKVMNEGVTLKNVKEVHIIDVFFNLPKAEQVIGRAIRMCVHKDVINDEYKFPKVNIFRYVIGLPDKDKLSSDEILYQKAELKYITIKEIERSLKEVAFDCPLLLHSNMFPEELNEYKSCVPLTIENVKAKKQICPALCDFKRCDLKCDSKKLNDTYWDEKNKTYKDIEKKDIDYNTFNDELAKNEINLIKAKIKDLFRFKHVYTYNEILEEIKDSFIDHQSKLFEDYFLNQSLHDMMPINENDFNNYKDIIYDKYNRNGYLIQRGKYYIFQPFNENEDIPLYYRQIYNIEPENQVSLKNFVKKSFKKDYENEQQKKKIEIKKIEYNFEDVMDYYNDREENFIVGIIDKDLFKIREPIQKGLNIKRGTGIPTLKGAVCSTAKDKPYLMKLIKSIPDIDNTEIKKINSLTREQICEELKNKLLYLEKFSTTKDGNKKTYVMIPFNHPTYEFPYNLEDRIKYIISNINKLVNYRVDVLVKKQKNKYELEIKYDTSFKDFIKNLEEMGFTLKNNLLTITLD